MNISWQWLSELIDLKGITPTCLAEKLTLASFEVESVTQNMQNDTILDISTTANRSDTISMVGMAKEIAAILKKPYKKTDNRLQLNIKYKKINDESNQCNHHIYSLIYNVNISSSPQWLQERLKQHDIQPVNNIIDVLNFVSLKWGQYIEVYDLNNIADNTDEEIELQVTSNKISGTFIDRSSKTIILPDKILTLIKNKNNILTLAGLTSNKKSQIHQNTKNILIATTSCNTQYIQEATKILNVSTTESLLQGKGIKTADLLDGYKEAILLIAFLSGGKIAQTVYSSRTTNIYKPIYIDKQHVDSVLGPEIIKSNARNKISVDTIFNLLNNLNLIIYKFSGYLQVNIPLSRINDLHRTIDIVEEVIRLYGFDQFLDKIPVAIHNTNGIKSITYYKLLHIRYILRSFGMHETMHSSLIYNHNHDLQIHNPITEEFNNLKNHLMCGLLESHKYNVNKGNEGIEIFETGRVFTANAYKYTESIHVAGILGAQSYTRPTWSHEPISLSWFQAKGQLEELFERLNMQITWKCIDSDWYLYDDLYKYFHPRYVVMLYTQEKAIGLFGEINIDFNKENNRRIYGFEIIINNLYSPNSNIHIFQEYSKYPSITRDINLSIDSKMPYSTIQNKIDNYPEPLIESIKLFDVYPHQKDKKNISLRVTYRSKTNTLTNTQIEQLEKKLKQSI